MKENITKIDASRRQIDTAIKLWFEGADPVAVHSLACSAYQIIHDINQHHCVRDLLYDTLVVKDEYRKEVVHLLKESYNFFKHADTDPDGGIEFDPDMTLLFILFTILGLELHGVKTDDIRGAFLLYFAIHNPQFFTEKGQKTFIESIPSEQIDNIGSISKDNFLKSYLLLRRKKAL